MLTYLAILFFSLIGWGSSNTAVNQDLNQDIMLEQIDLGKDDGNGNCQSGGK